MVSYKLVEKGLVLLGWIALAIIVMGSFMSGFGAKLMENLSSLFVFFFLFVGIPAVVLKYVVIGNICYRPIFYCTKTQEDPAALLQSFKKEGISLYYERVLKHKKSWGYAYFTRVSKDDLGRLPNCWKEYKDEDLENNCTAD